MIRHYFNLEKYLPEQHHYMQQHPHQYQHQQQAQLPLPTQLQQPPPTPISISTTTTTTTTTTATTTPSPLPLQQQLQLHQIKPLSDINLGNPNSNMADINQFSSSTEDIFDLLLQFEREPSNSTGLDCNYVLDQDDQVGIENIRKQLMSYDVQSLNQHQVGSVLGGADPMSPTPSIVEQNTCNPQPQQQQQSTHTVVHHQHQTQSTSQPQILPQNQPQSQGQTQNLPQHQLHIHKHHQPHQTIINQTTPVITQQQQQHQQQSHQLPTSGLSPTSSAGQSMLLSSYSSSPIWSPVQQQHHQQQHQQSTSPQLHPSTCGLHERQDTPSLSVSPQSSSAPAATNTQAAEPSPVVKRNPLLNAQLVNSFNKAANKINSQNNSVLNQNPILNAKLSQSPFLAGTSDSPIPPSAGSPVSPNFNSRGRFMQQARQSPSFNYEMSQHQQQQQQQQSGRQTQSRHMSMFGSLEQPASQVYRTSQTTPICTPSPTNEGFSQQVKQEMRRKQPHETSLLKQLLSDDN